MPWILIGCHEPATVNWADVQDEYNIEPSQNLIVVEKAERRISVYQDSALSSWSIGLGDVPTGHKTAEGDEKTPEGLYNFSDYAASSSYHGSLLIHYPNVSDGELAVTNNQISQSQL